MCLLVVGALGSITSPIGTCCILFLFQVQVRDWTQCVKKTQGLHPPQAPRGQQVEHQGR